MGRNGKQHHILASDEVLARTGIEYFETDRGGDVTYHGPGQVVGYPILDLREWKRDVHAYFQGVEQALINALAGLGLAAERVPERGSEGVWVKGAKVAAIGIHISRWITSHGFALNVDTELDYFKYIVPCGLTKPVCSLRSLGCQAGREEVISAVAASFAEIFDYELVTAQQELQETR
jgi:lipoate-protein ligase B